MVGTKYSDDQGGMFIDPPSFYLTPYDQRKNMRFDGIPAPVTADQDSKLSNDFSCANLWNSLVREVATVSGHNGPPMATPLRRSWTACSRLRFMVRLLQLRPPGWSWPRRDGRALRRQDNGSRLTPASSLRGMREPTRGYGRDRNRSAIALVANDWWICYSAALGLRFE